MRSEKEIMEQIEKYKYLNDEVKNQGYSYDYEIEIETLEWVLEESD